MDTISLTSGLISINELIIKNQLNEEHIDKIIIQIFDDAIEKSHLEHRELLLEELKSQSLIVIFREDSLDDYLKLVLIVIRMIFHDGYKLAEEYAYELINKIK